LPSQRGHRAKTSGANRHFQQVATGKVLQALVGLDCGNQRSIPGTLLSPWGSAFFHKVISFYADRNDCCGRKRNQSQKGRLEMKISTKLSLFYVAVLAVFCLLAFALTTVLQSVSVGYDALLNTPVRQIDQARVTQVDFKKEVQEWKDVLLRGHNPDDLATYTKQFREMETQVQMEANALSLQVQDAEAKQLLEQFLTANLILSQKYQLAYDAFVAGKADFKGADKIVRGQDRPPTNLFDKVVQRLDTVVQESVQAQTQAAVKGRNLAFGIAGGLVVLIGIVGLFMVRDIVDRLGRLKAVSDRLALADISGLAIDVSGRDEISAFGRSMKGVLAAIEELLRMSALETVGKP
jgi:methyl-accepting chemotaxis protein